MSVRYIIEAVDLATGPMAKVDKAFDKTAAKYDKLQGKSQRLRDEQGRFVASTKNTGTAIDGLGSKLARLGAVGAGIGAALSVTALVNYGRAAVSTAAKFEKMQAVLSNKLGSQFAGEQSMDMLKEFAKVTPYSVEELTASYMKLVSQGFKPTMDEMRSMGDLASSMGKPFDQLAEAVLDAQTGEFERLKEFGIKARAEGDKIALTFSGQTTTIDKSAEAMRKYLVSLGDAKGVMGSMAVISKTTEGLESNLEDAWTSLSATVGDRLTPSYKELLKTGIDLATNLENLVKVPIEEKIQGQIDKIMTLTGEMFSTNTKHERQLELLEELKKINPKIVEGIDAQNISYSDLRKNIDGVIEGMQKKIMLEGINRDNLDKIQTYEDAKASASKTFGESLALVAKISPELAKRTDLTTGQKVQEAQYLLQEKIRSGNVTERYRASTGGTGGMGSGSFYTEEGEMLRKLQNTIKANKNARSKAAELAPEMAQLDAVKKTLSDQIDSLVTPKDDAVTPTNGNKKDKEGDKPRGSSKAATSTANNIASGGVRPTTINMTFHKLQDQIVIHTTNLQTGSKQAGEMVVEEILRALNGANAALAAQ